MKYNRDVIEVAKRYVSFEGRDTRRIYDAVIDTMSRPNPSPAKVRKAVEMSERLAFDAGDDFSRRSKLVAQGISLYRAGHYADAEGYLVQYRNLYQNKVTENQFMSYNHRHTIESQTAGLVLAMSRAQLGRIEEARRVFDDWPGSALIYAGPLGRIGVRNANDSVIGLYNDATAMIFDKGFPTEPFAR